MRNYVAILFSALSPVAVACAGAVQRPLRVYSICLALHRRRGSLGHTLFVVGAREIELLKVVLMFYFKLSF